MRGIRYIIWCSSRKNNIGSSQTILNNGGIPDSDFIEKDGNIIKGYWMELWVLLHYGHLVEEAFENK